MLWLLAVTLGVPAILICIDALHPKQCSEIPAVGTTIEVPGEYMTIVPSEHANVVTFDVIRDPFKDPSYTLNPIHGHIHPNQAEGFRIIDGRAKILVGDETFVLGPEDSYIIPPNTLHHWMALDRKPVHVEAFFEPRLDVASWFLHFQKHVANGTMDLFQAAIISREYTTGSPVPADPHPLIWSVVSRVLAPIARIMGYKPC